MDPVLVEIGPFVIRWYGIMMALMILLAVVMAYRYGPRLGVPTEELDRLTIPFIIIAVIGARVGYVLSHPAEFANPLEILRIDRGGLTSHGAIAGALILLWVTSRRRNLSFWSLADTTAWAVPLGNVFVRFGNFMNGELYGDITRLPWAVTFPGVPGPRHPLQIYEMILGLIVLLIAMRVANRRRFPGELFWTIMVLSSIGRIFLDLLRSEDRVFWVLTLGQIPALVLLIGGLWFLSTKNGRVEARSPKP
ncbi:MAG: prolipoprotein diacylglyceryl transferase [Armatimonadetes bacterium]|nr:prolipoprotein diacylglyceryl transferase [Armatimonadota bacterium]